MQSISILFVTLSDEFEINKIAPSLSSHQEETDKHLCVSFIQLIYITNRL